jgi:hypothetical protein
MKKLINNLVKVANYLDTEAMYEESNTITEIAIKLAQSMDDIVEDDDVEDIDDEDLDIDGEDDIDLDDEDLDIDEDDGDNMQELSDLLDELGVSEKEKLEIIEMVKKDTDNVEEFAYSGPMPPSDEDEDLYTDEMLGASDDMDAQNLDLNDMDSQEEQSAADDAQMSENGFDDIRSILQDDPELLKWYESLGTDVD